MTGLGWRGVDVGGRVPGAVAYYGLVSNYVTASFTFNKGPRVTLL